MSAREPAGMRVEYHAGWFVRQVPSRLPMTPSLRLRRHAEAAMADLAATGVDFTRPAEELRRSADLRKAQRAALPWYERADRCCDPRTGEHCSPYTYRLPDGRCSGRAGGDRSSLPDPRRRRR